ncbi:MULTISPECIES: PAS domain-containing sensor histidine kinase [Haloarcula]|uniref:PAS domain-containing sensor histidine kinase n=1 Tax=Haloarcula TaxID=2237 RepID=UPI0023EBFAA1|nr:PAS domain-containing sensor histidine kinase [Halomicroarcula sp. XH51]
MSDRPTDRIRLAEAAFDELPDQVAVLDTDGVIRLTNHTWDSFGFENGIEGDVDMVGQNYLTVCHDSLGDRSQTIADGIESVIAGETDEFSLEYPCHTSEAQRWFTVRVTPFELAGESLVLVVHTDVTERHLAEQSVSERNDQLEQVAGILSHDLRNPLSVALAHAEMVVDGEAPEEDHDTQILESLQRMNAIIDDALLLARGTEVTDVDEVDLASTARDAWDQVSTAGASLSVAGTAPVRADASLLAQLFENLFRNAVEHGAVGDGDLTVTVEPLEDGFVVADDGQGIPEEKLEQVFEPGYSTNRDDGGTGLGLPIVERIADAHGWAVEASAAPDGGAMFVVTGVTLAE